MKPTLIVQFSCLLVSSTVWAYVPPAAYILRLWVEARLGQDVKDITVTMRTYQGDTSDDDDGVEEKLYMKVPERLRRATTKENDVMVYVEKEGTSGRGTERGIKRSGPSTDLLAALLVFARGSDSEVIAGRMLAKLQGAGIDTSITGLGRSQHKVVYVIGAKSWEKDKPQVWLDKDGLFPLKYITHDKTEVRLLDWGAPQSGHWFASVVEVYRKGKLTSHSEVGRVQINQNLAETLFDPGLP